MFWWIQNLFETSLDYVSQHINGYISVGMNVYNVLSNNIKTTSIFDVLIISDGMHNVYKYLYEMFVIKITQDSLNIQTKKRLISDYKKLYSLAYIDRYLLYILVYICFNFIQVVLPDEIVVKRVLYFISFLIGVPRVQNTLLDIPFIQSFVISFIEKKNTFLFYSLSKTIIRFIKKLSPDIIDIQNLHIFILYNYLNVEFITEFLKTLGVIIFLNTIRQYESTYYYYKAIKLSYYYNTGYLFNVITKHDAVYLINTMIKQKQWKSFCKREIVNALYSLSTTQQNFKTHWIELNLIMIKIFSIWSVLCLLKIFSTFINTYFLVFYVLFIYAFSIKHKTKHIALSILIYTLLLLNINELLIAIVFIKYNILYDSLIDFLFFITNYNQLQKIFKFYSPKTN